MKTMDEINDRYMSISKPVNGVLIEAVVKFDDEGVVIDLWWDGMVIQSTWKLYDELPIKLKEGR